MQQSLETDCLSNTFNVIFNDLISTLNQAFFNIPHGPCNENKINMQVTV